MNDNWKFSDLPYTSPDVEALQARYDALTQRPRTPKVRRSCWRWFGSGMPSSRR